MSRRWARAEFETAEEAEAACWARMGLVVEGRPVGVEPYRVSGCEQSSLENR